MRLERFCVSIIDNGTTPVFLCAVSFPEDFANQTAHPYEWRVF